MPRSGYYLEVTGRYKAVVGAVLALATAAAPCAASPPGANDFKCRPSADHAEPVVLVHGLGANMDTNWGYMSPRIAAAGYCVFALTYGRATEKPSDPRGGVVSMKESAHELARFVDRVLAATGARKVDIVGHSEGSLMPDYYVKFLPRARHGDGSPKVDDYVGITPLWRGSRRAPLLDGGGCPACRQIARGSGFLNEMNRGPTGPRVPGVSYTMLMTLFDQVVAPVMSGYMDGATNLFMQGQCAADTSKHVGMAINPNVLGDVLHALDPADTTPVDCASLYGF
jgi:pimeloyl-ACP methyl ester carboxylesterase